MSLFSRDARQTSAPRSSGPNVIEARRNLQSWGACGETGERFGEREIFLLILSKGVGSGHSLSRHPFWQLVSCWHPSTPAQHSQVKSPLFIQRY